MAIKRTFSSIFFCLIAVLAMAQKEASIWPIGSGKEFNFQNGNIEYSDFTGNNSVNSTICDKDGNLVLYTNGRTIWNRNNEIIANGDNMISDKALVKNPPVFLPYPDRPNWYILIYEEDFSITNIKGEIVNSIYYAEIDASAQGGRGAIMNRGMKLHDNYHSGVTIAAYCSNSFYWLTVERNENVIKGIYRDRIYSYKFDKAGLNPVPVINELLDIGNSGNYKFSPDGDKISFVYQENTTQALKHMIADFNFLTGELYNMREVGFIPSNEPDFSPNSQFLYFFSGYDMIQVDARYSTKSLIMNSAKTILSLPSIPNVEYPYFELQTAPDGKIYFSYKSPDGKRHLGVINQPNKIGSESDVQINLYTADRINLPDFVTSFFSEKNIGMTEEVKTDLNDIEVCSNSSVAIKLDNPGVFYSWVPEMNISNPFSGVSVYNPISLRDILTPKSLTYVLRATDKQCWVNFDTINIKVLPVPKKLTIEGSWSVCPSVEEVEYATKKDGNSLHWIVNGGEIHSGQSTESIKVNWGETNSKASVNVFSTNHYSCNSDTASFPVRINVELITETPKGVDKLCIADSKNVEYQIRNTNGSIYSWVAENGDVISGQGTSKVLVDWHGEGFHELLVEESSTTIDTICFGASVPLIIEVINDSLEISLDLVSFDLDNKLNISYSSDKLKDKHSLFLITRDENGTAPVETSMKLSPDNFYRYSPSKLSPQVITLKVVNTCEETTLSNASEPIILEGEVSVIENSIHLKWNNNRFWKNDITSIEVWHSINGLSEWRLLSEGEFTTDYIFNIDGVSLTHHFRVKEINHDKHLESWSNRLEFLLDDQMSIPDVFTPNGDGINDMWLIGNFKFHSFQSVTIYDRLGQVVYQCNNEYLPWDGRVNGSIYQGTYFYQIIFDQGIKKYGYVTVLQ